jgi:hypothetical protein
MVSFVIRHGFLLKRLRKLLMSCMPCRSQRP